jgi:hypothetical protein
MALDWAVAEVLGFQPTLEHPLFCSSPAWFGLCNPPHWLEPDSPFCPSKRWAHGGELVEHYIRWLRDPANPGELWNESGALYLAVGVNGKPAFGATKLQAVCRAVVANARGDLVSVPSSTLGMSAVA